MACSKIRAAQLNALLRIGHVDSYLLDVCCIWCAAKAPSNRVSESFSRVLADLPESAIYGVAGIMSGNSGTDL